MEQRRKTRLKEGGFRPDELGFGCRFQQTCFSVFLVQCPRTSHTNGTERNNHPLECFNSEMHLAFGCFWMLRVDWLKHFSDSSRTLVLGAFLEKNIKSQVLNKYINQPTYLIYVASILHLVSFPIIHRPVKRHQPPAVAGSPRPIHPLPGGGLRTPHHAFQARTSRALDKPNVWSIGSTVSHGWLRGNSWMSLGAWWCCCLF